jgi:hypothetical protein
VNFETALRAIEGARGSVVAGDASLVDVRLSTKLEAVAASEALRRMSVDFDRLIILRGRSVVLQRRFGDPDEEPGVEVEELRLATDQMYRLVSAFMPDIKGGLPSIMAKIDFVASITPDQQRRMQTPEGLPLAELDAEQRGAFTSIVRFQGYNSAYRELRRAMLCVGGLNRCSMQEIARLGGKRSQVAVRFADPEQRGGDAVSMGVPTRNLSPYVAFADSAELPTRSGLPSNLRVPWSVPLERFNLAAFNRRFFSETGLILHTPEYAQERTFWLSSRGGTRGEVLQALADLWGWSVSEGKGGFRLGYPRLGRARDASDLKALVERATPPPIRHQVRALKASVTERWAKQMGAVLASADRAAGKDWKQMKVADLDAEAKQRLANQLLITQVAEGWGSYWQGESPPEWLTAPERGFVRLNGPIGPGLHPHLGIWVPLPPTRPGERRHSMFGWFVGTSSIESPGQPARAETGVKP